MFKEVSIQNFYNQWKDFVDSAPVFEVRWNMFPESSKPETIIEKVNLANVLRELYFGR